MKVKKCPLCNNEKHIDNFHSYFSKVRNKIRIGNYCKPCAREKAKVRAIEYYKKNKETKKEYAKKYREENKDKIKVLSAHFTKKYREELKECYVAEQAAKNLKCSTKEIHENPELLKAYKNNLLIKRQIRNYGTK